MADELMMLDASPHARAEPAHPIRRFVGAHPVAAVFVVALALRMLAAAVLIHLGDGVLAVFDDDTYTRLAADVARGQTAGWDAYNRTLYNATAAFTLPLTFLFRVFGVHSYLGPLLAGVLGAATAALVTRVGREVVTDGWALVAGLVVALLPSQVLWSSLALKDSSVWAATAGVGVACAVAARRVDGRGLAACGGASVALLIGLAHLRAHTFVLAAWGFAIAFGLLPKRRAVTAPVAVAVLVILPLYFGYGVAGFRLIGSSPSEIQERRVLNAFGAASAFVSEDELPPEVREAQRELEELRDDLGAVSTNEHRAASLVEELRALVAAGEASPEELAAAEAELRRLRTVSERAEELREIVSTAQGEAVSEEDDSGAVAANLAHLPRGLRVMLVEPLPWQSVDGARQIAAKAETMVLYPLLALAVVGLVIGRRRRVPALLFPTLTAGAVLLAYALTEGNFGTAYRHRSELAPAIVLLAVVGASELRSRRAAARGEAT